MAISTLVPAETSASFPEERWNEAADYKCRLSVELKVASFTVCDFLQLKTGTVVSSALAANSDVPLLVNDKQIAAVTMESKNQNRAARIRDIA